MGISLKLYKRLRKVLQNGTEYTRYKTKWTAQEFCKLLDIKKDSLYRYNSLKYIVKTGKYYTVENIRQLYKQGDKYKKKRGKVNEKEVKKRVFKIFNEKHPGYSKAFNNNAKLREIVRIYFIRGRYSNEDCRKVFGFEGYIFLKKWLKKQIAKTFFPFWFRSKYYMKYPIDFPSKMVEYVTLKVNKKHFGRIYHETAIEYMLYCYFFEILNLLRQDISFKFDKCFELNIKYKDIIGDKIEVNKKIIELYISTALRFNIYRELNNNNLSKTNNSSLKTNNNLLKTNKNNKNNELNESFEFLKEYIDFDR